MTTNIPKADEVYSESDLLHQRLILTAHQFKDGVDELNVDHDNRDDEGLEFLEATLCSLRSDLAELRALHPA